MDEKCRDRFRFRLRTLLIGVTLAGVLFAFGAPMIRKWQRDVASRKKMHQLGLLLGRQESRYRCFLWQSFGDRPTQIQLGSRHKWPD